MNFHILTPHGPDLLWLIPALIGVLLVVTGFVAASRASAATGSGRPAGRQHTRILVGQLLLIVGVLGGLLASVSIASSEQTASASATLHANETHLTQAAKDTYGIQLPRAAAYHLLRDGEDYIDGDNVNRQRWGTGSYLQAGAVHNVNLYHIGGKWILVDAGTKLELAHR